MNDTVAATPVSAEASSSGQRASKEQSDHSDPDTRSLAAESHSEDPEATMGGEEELTARTSQMNGSAAVTQPDHTLEEGKPEDGDAASMDPRPEEGQTQNAEDMHPPDLSMREESTALKSREQHLPKAGALLDRSSHVDTTASGTSDSQLQKALPDRQADEASQAAGLISAEQEPETSSQADADLQDSTPATAVGMLATAGSLHTPKEVLEAEQDSHPEAGSLMPGSLTSAIQQTSIWDAEQSRQNIAEAARKALSTDAERLEGTAILEQTQIESLLHPQREHADEAHQCQSESAVGSGKQDKEAQAILADLYQLSEASSPNPDSSEPQPSANTIEEMLRSMQKEEWDTD